MTNTEEYITYEKVPLKIFADSSEASKSVAREISDLIRSKQKQNTHCVLGLATGSSPKSVYKELVRMHNEEGLSFQNVFSFNLDEYYPISVNDLNSYDRFMREHLFDKVDIPKENYFLPSGTIQQNEVKSFCEAYENKIDVLGGLDFQLLGIGRNGHIGFNEPGSLVNSRTRLITLDHTTRVAAMPDFRNQLYNVPKKAITMGISKILQAKRIVLLAWGEQKAKIIHDSIEGKVMEQIPASYLQTHHNALVVIDEAAATELTRRKTPWLVKEIVWDSKMTKKAVTQLAILLDKSILKLTNKDYNDNGLSDLLAQYGRAYDVNIKVFREIQQTITGWPGGKPNSKHEIRPERAKPIRKKSLIFSPHPDDDIISMGGTLQRLVDQGHEVHVAYQTSGNIAVSDEEALRFIDFAVDFNEKFKVSKIKANEIFQQAKSFLLNKNGSEIDIPELRFVKGLIRRSEAKATCRFVGVSDENIHFLDLPFYETGRVQKNPLGETDIEIVMGLIKHIKPHQIFAAGDLADPHGTHKVCLDVIFKALKKLKAKIFMDDCWLWLYRGAWAEWQIHEIEMAVPMSPDQVLQKRFGIFKHQSQKDGVVFQGEDSREFWQRAEERNHSTAELYNNLGFTEYEAIEAFVRWEY